MQMQQNYNMQPNASAQNTTPFTHKENPTSLSGSTNVAVLLAGGTGARIGGSVPKQLLPLSDGRSVLEHAVEAFEQAACIDEIGIVMHKDYIACAEAMLLRNGWQKVVFVIAGGSERWESSVKAIQEIERREAERHRTQPAAVHILLHDAARPFVSERIITDVCASLQQHEAVAVALPAADTIYTVAPQGKSETAERTVQDIPPRSTLMCAQTPQAFHLATIAEAYRLALQDIEAQTSALSGNPHLPATDDCGIVHRYLPSVPIHIVLGDPSNRKLTYKEDL